MKKYGIALAGLLFTAQANAGAIGVWGGNFALWNSYISNTGNTAVSVSASSTLAGLSGLDRVWLIRTSGDLDLVNYVSGGGTLVTEWSGARWAVNANLLDADISDLSYVGTNTPITFSAEGTALGLGSDTGNPYANGGSTEFFWSFSNLGSDVRSVASIPGHNVGVAGSYGSGNVLALGWDWQDALGGEVMTQNFVNDITGVELNPASVPEPSLPALLSLGLALLGWSRRKPKG